MGKLTPIGSVKHSLALAIDAKPSDPLTAGHTVSKPVFPAIFISPSTSLVIPVYNRAAYLPAAIESILAQTYPDFELLLWDDGSTDDSVAIATHYAQRDKRVRVVAAAHQGQTGSLKAAIAQTTGTYVAWVDSDDLLAPTALAETIAILNAKPNVGLVYTNYQVINAEGTVQGLGSRCQIPYSKERSGQRQPARIGQRSPMGPQTRRLRFVAAIPGCRSAAVRAESGQSGGCQPQR